MDLGKDKLVPTSVSLSDLLAVFRGQMDSCEFNNRWNGVQRRIINRSNVISTKQESSGSRSQGHIPWVLLSSCEYHRMGSSRNIRTVIA